MKKIIASLVLFLVACGGATQGNEQSEESSAEARACVQTALCIQGYVWSQKTCSCVPDKGPKCGTKTCGAHEYCCNSSCGICAPLGSACIQIACTPQ